MFFWDKDMKSENNQQQNLGSKSLRMVRFEISHLTPVSRSNRLSIKVPCLECFRMVFACFKYFWGNVKIPVGILLKDLDGMFFIRYMFLQAKISSKKNTVITMKYREPTLSKVPDLVLSQAKSLTQSWAFWFRWVWGTNSFQKMELSLPLTILITWICGSVNHILSPCVTSVDFEAVHSNQSKHLT